MITTIKSISDSQSEILKNILTIYNLEKFDADITYSKGNFYKDGSVPQPEFKSDKLPSSSEVVEADYTNLPVADGVFQSVVFDPPFLPTLYSTSAMFKRFSGFATHAELHDSYKQALAEIFRVLKPEGICVFKCQDFVNSRKNWWIHINVHNYALEQGFIVDDLYILLAKSRMRTYNTTVQQHCRKFHSYLWVLKKPKERRNGHRIS